MGLMDRRLADLTVGDVFKGWAIYVIGGAVLSLIVGAIAVGLFQAPDPTRGEGVFRPGSGVRIPDEGTAIGPAQFKAVKVGDRKDAVLDRLGPPAGTESPKADISPQYYTDCATYRVRGDETSMYVICFESGRVFEKERF